MGKPKQKIGQPDFILILAILGLLCIGLVMVFSASQYMAQDSPYNNSFYFLKRQARWAIIGIIAMFVVMRVDPEWFKKLAFPTYVGTVICLILVITGLGANELGATRTLVLGPIHFQPSEIGKLAIVLTFAKLMSENQRDIKTFNKGYLPYIASLMLLCGLIMLQPDLGTCIAIAGVAFLMMMAGGTRPKYLGGTVLLGIIGVVLAIILEPFRLRRFTVWFDPWSDPIGTGFQTVQSLIAIGSGGLTGVGLGSGGSKWYYLPEIHTDMIFSILGEELGFIGCALTIFLFALFVYRGLKIALNLEDSFQSLVAVGVTSMIGVQAMINLYVATGLMPVTGIALPFISYGGTSLCITLGVSGILLNLSRFARKGGR